MVYREPAEIKKEVEFKKPWYWLFGNKYTFDSDNGVVYNFYYIRKRSFRVGGNKQILFKTINKNYVFIFSYDNNKLIYYSNSPEKLLKQLENNANFTNLYTPYLLKFKNNFEKFFGEKINIPRLKFHEL